MRAPRWSAPVPDTAFQLGGRYHLVTRLARAGMVGSYAAWDAAEKDWRAVKVLFPGYADRASHRRRFHREAHALLALDHDHVVRALAVDTDAPLPYVVVDLPTGGTLEDWQQRHGPMPPRLAVRASADLCRGVARLNDAGMPHCDIHPRNVWVDADGRCRIGDPWLAANLESHSRAIDVPGDVYAIGSVLYTLLTCNPHEDLLMSGVRMDQVPLSLAAPLARSLHSDRNERFASLAALEAALVAALEDLGPDPQGASPFPATTERLPGAPCADWDELRTAALPPPTPPVSAQVLFPEAPAAASGPRWVDAVLSGGLVMLGLGVFAVVVAGLAAPVAVVMGAASVDAAEAEAIAAKRVLDLRGQDRERLLADFQRVTGIAPAVLATDPAFERALAAQTRLSDMGETVGNAQPRQRLQRLVAAVDASDEADAAWTAAAAHPFGQLAVTLGLSQAPDFSPTTASDGAAPPPPEAEQR